MMDPAPAAKQRRVVNEPTHIACGEGRRANVDLSHFGFGTPVVATNLTTISAIADGRTSASTGCNACPYEFELAKADSAAALAGDIIAWFLLLIGILTYIHFLVGGHQSE